MKKIIIILFIFIFSCNDNHVDTVLEEEPTYDFFPLEVGNAWHFSFTDYAGVNYDWNDYDGTIKWNVIDRHTKNDTIIFVINEDVAQRKISYIPEPEHYDTFYSQIENQFLIKETSNNWLIFEGPNYLYLNIALKRYYYTDGKNSVIDADFMSLDYRRYSIELMHNKGVRRMSIRPDGNSGRRPDVDLVGTTIGKFFE